MHWFCPVCGAEVETSPKFEHETYAGRNGAELKIVIPYCGDDGCDPVKAANLMDRLAEPFFDAVGAR